MVAAEVDAEADLTSPVPSSGTKLATRSPVAHRRGLLDSAYGGSRPAAPCRKKTRDLPDLSVCHGCGLRYPDKGRKGSLSALKSQWRLVLLCSNCRGHVRSGAFCSYCLSRFSDAENGGSMNCLECHRRVHLSCLLRQRGYIVPSDLDPRTFLCVDCHAVPKFLLPRTNYHEVASEGGVSMEDVARNANYILAKKKDEALKAKKKALEKALAARHATELARNALDLVSFVSKQAACDSDFVDEQLALQMHRAMNGSQRISRSPCSSTSENLFFSKKKIAAVFSSGRNSLSGSSDASLDVRICMENKSFASVDVRALENSVCNLEVKAETPLQMNFVVDRSMVNDHEKRKYNMEGDRGKEEQASCSNKVFTSAISDNSADSIFALSERSSNSHDEQCIPNNAAEGEADGDVSGAHLRVACNIGDRYVKKYIRNFRMKRYGKKYCRNSTLSNRADEKSSEGSSSILLSCQSLSSSNTHRSNFIAHSESLAAVFNDSANATRLSKCHS